MKKIIWIVTSGILLIVVIAVIQAIWTEIEWSQNCDTQPWPCGMLATGNSNAFVYTPYPADKVITSPVEIGGAIRVSLIPKEGVRATVVNWDGLIIGEVVLTRVEEDPVALTARPDYDPAQRFVWFRGTVSFTPTECGKDQDFCRKGAIIFGKQYELPVRFK